MSTHDPGKAKESGLGAADQGPSCCTQSCEPVRAEHTSSVSEVSSDVVFTGHLMFCLLCQQSAGGCLFYQHLKFQPGTSGKETSASASHSVYKAWFRFRLGLGSGSGPGYRFGFGFCSFSLCNLDMWG